MSNDLETQLRSAQSHLAGVESAARLCSYVLDLNTRSVSWSSEAYALFGIPADTPLTRALILEHVHPEDRGAVIQAVEALSRGEIYDLEHRIIVNGKIVWVRARTVLEYDDTGTPRRAIGVAQDISLERETERSLRERFDFEHFVSQLSTRFVTGLDADSAIDVSLADLGRFTRSDRAHVFRFDEAGALFSNTHEWCAEGVASEIAASQQLRSSDFAWWLHALRRGELIPIEDVAALPPEAAMERQICERQGIRALLTLPILLDGELVAYAGLENIHEPRPWSQVQCRALRVFSELLGTALRRERSEARAQVLAHRLAHTLETMTDAFFMLDRDWSVSYVNRQAELLLQCSRQELLGRSVWERFADAWEMDFGREYRRAMDEGRAAFFEALYPPVGRWFEVRAYPSADGLAVYFTDVTARRAEQLEREKLQAQLRQAQKLEAVGRLAGGVAHDFNNMLNVILGSVDLALLELEDTHPLARNLQGIREAGLRSAEITRQLLGFASKQTIAPQVLDLNATISGMVGMLERLIGEGVALRWTPCPDIPAVKIDPAQVDQILVNLIINARDSIGGHGTVSIDTRIVTADQALCATHEGMLPGECYVELNVRDDGAGMDDETRTRVFEPFYSTKRPGEGSGLGLATVYGIVRQNAGFIAVASAKGAGACFSILLPAFGEGAVVVASSDASTETRPARGDETLLLVEDEPLLLTLTQRTLEELGYTVLAADSPVQALALFDRHEGSIDLLVSDVIMPGMSGRELWQVLLERKPELPCVFMSGYPQDVLAPHGVLDEGFHFLQKPFRMSALAECIRKALDAAA